jgi:hypothetical protein
VLDALKLSGHGYALVFTTQNKAIIRMQLKVCFLLSGLIRLTGKNELAE